MRLHAAPQVAAHSIQVLCEPQARLLLAVGRPHLRGIEGIDGRMIVNVSMITSDVMIIDSGTTIVHAHFRIGIILQGVASIKVVHRQGRLHSGPVDPRTDHLHLEDPGILLSLIHI